MTTDMKEKSIRTQVAGIDVIEPHRPSGTIQFNFRCDFDVLRRQEEDLKLRALAKASRLKRDCPFPPEPGLA